MSKESIRKNIQQLRKKIKDSPRVWKFRGRRVVPVDNWTFEDWTTLPDQFTLVLISAHPPEDWLNDFNALMYKIRDPEFAWQMCLQKCAIAHAQSAKELIDSWRWGPERGGEEAKQKFYDTCEKTQAEEFRRRDAFEQVKLRILNELGGARGRTCTVLNFFKCPYGEEYNTLCADGEAAYELLDQLRWYDKHWNRSSSDIPAQNDMKWYHFNEPPIIDVTCYEDICKAVDDGRLDKIVAERKRYMKESGYES